MRDQSVLAFIFSFFQSIAGFRIRISHVPVVRLMSHHNLFTIVIATCTLYHFLQH